MTVGVTVVKEGILGLSVKEIGGHRLRVDGILQNGCVAKHNGNNPDSGIKIGDIITEVNGEGATLDAIQKVNEGEQISFQVNRGQQAPKAQAMAEAKPVCVTVVKEGVLGLSVKEIAGQRLKVDGIFQNGCVAKHNGVYPDFRIEMGDIITDVNGEGATLDAIQKVNEGEQIMFRIDRGPQLPPVPPGVPEGSRFQHEKFIGNNTTVVAVVGCLCLGPLACLILACPVDERDVYIASDGRKFTAAGAVISKN